jgi:hypothetical protein
MGKAIRASALVLLLTCSAYAGEMQNDVKQPTPAPTQEATADGWIPNDLTDTVLSVLGSVLALL